MTTHFSLTAQARDLHGKGASRRLRHLSLVPAVLYGNNTAATSITVPLKDLVKCLESEAFYSQILSIDVDGTVEKVVLKALQRHPVKGLPMHADFLRIDETHALTLHVPLHYINQETCVGVKGQGGSISIIATDVEISTLPANLPEYLVVDMLTVEAGTTLHLSDIQLPAGVSIPSLAQGASHDQPIAIVNKAVTDTDK